MASTRITPDALDQMPVSDALRVLLRRFPRLRKQSAFVRECLEWQDAASPRPNFYFRGHLCLAGKVMTGQVRRAAKLLTRRGSTLFFAATKAGEVDQKKLTRLAI